MKLILVSAVEMEIHLLRPEVLMLNIYIKSGHGSVMKKQLFYLYKLGIVRSVMTAYFIS